MTLPIPLLTPTPESQFVHSGVRYRPAAGTTILALTTDGGEAIGYMERGHIFVWKSTDGFVTASPLLRPDDYNFDSSGTSIVLVTPSVAGEEYVLFRDTPLKPYIVFADGSMLTAEQLNRLARVNLYRDQEQADAFLSGGGGGGGGGSGGTVVRVQGGAGLTGDITVAGSLNVGAGAGISALVDSVAINRATVDAWYAPIVHGHALVTSSVPGFMSAPDKVALDALVAAPPPSAGSLDSLSDVVISGPEANEILLFDGTKWKNSLAGGPGTGNVQVAISRTWTKNAPPILLGSGFARAIDGTANWSMATAIEIHYIDSKTGVSNESALRNVGAGSTLRLSHAAGSISYTVVGTTLDDTQKSALVSVTAPELAGATPNNGTPVSITLNAAVVQEGAVELNQLNDVTLTSPADDQILKYDSTTQQWVNAAAPAGGGGATNLDGLTDVTITTATTDQILKFNGSQWVNAAAPAGGGGATNLDGLTDVTITTATTDQILKFNGSQWVNAAAPAGGGGGVSSVSGTAPIAVATGTTTPVVSIAVASASSPGSMSSADFTKLAGIAPGATANAGTVTNVSGAAPIQVTTGTSTPAISIVPATTSVPGSMSAADKAKLDGVAPGATANSTDAQLRGRATHTGTQLAATISDFTASSRAEVEATLTAGANITLTPSGTGATRTIEISSTGSGGGSGGTTFTTRNWSTATTGSVVSGQGRANALSWGSLTQLVIHEVSAGGLNESAALMALQVGNSIQIESPQGTGLFSLSGAPTTASGQVTLNVIRIQTSGGPPTAGAVATLKFSGAGGSAGGAGTVTQVDGGAGLTGSVTTTGALAVGAGTGITVNADDVAVNRAVVNTWYLPMDFSTLPALP